MSDTDSQGTVDVSAHPGAILKAAREESPYTMEQVADALHLRSTVVLAMEQERYHEFDSEVFLKGYYRSYCRLVGLHEERMVELLEKQLQVHRSALAEEAAEVERARIARKRQKYSRYGIAAVVLVLVLLALVLEMEDEQSSPDEVVSPSQSLEPSESLSPPSSDKLEEFAEPALSEEDLEPEFEQSEMTEDESFAPIGVDPVLEPPSGISELQAQQEQLEEPLSTDQVAAESVASSNPETAGSEPGQALVMIRFSGDCWFKLVNGEGRTPIARLQRAGDEVRYEGPAPYRLVLGDARVAEVEFMGERIDLSAYTRSNGRAEFVLEMQE